MRGQLGPLLPPLAASSMEFAQATSDSHHLVLTSPSRPGPGTGTQSWPDVAILSQYLHLLTKRGRSPVINSYAQSLSHLTNLSEQDKLAKTTNISLEGRDVTCPAPGDFPGLTDLGAPHFQFS